MLGVSASMFYFFYFFSVIVGPREISFPRMAPQSTRMAKTNLLVQYNTQGTSYLPKVPHLKVRDVYLPLICLRYVTIIPTRTFIIRCCRIWITEQDMNVFCRLTYECNRNPGNIDYQWLIIFKSPMTTSMSCILRDLGITTPILFQATR